jgi:ribonuclease HII
MLVAGVDEAGRGSLVSRVYAAAVIVPEDFMDMASEEEIVIRDSKKMTARQRERSAAWIEQNAIACAVAYADETEIDRVNILEATMNAMHRAIEGLQVGPDHLCVDGSVFRPFIDVDGYEIPHECIVRGDDTNPAIASASILAKTHRDDFITRLATEHPELERYDLSHNMGYGTAAHVRALQEWGHSVFHRRSFHVKGVASRRLLI